MNWNERIAREGIWFGCLLGGVLLFWSAFAFFIIGCDQIEYWGPLLDIGHRHHTGNLLITIIPIAFVYLIRLIAWSIKQFTKE